MEPTHPDTFEGYLVTLGDGVLEVHKCATLWTVNRPGFPGDLVT
jgi:hypothetical protein